MSPFAGRERATHRQLRRLARRTLRDLGLDPPLDHAALAFRLGERQGRPIHLVPTFDLPPAAAFGVTGGDETRDVVLYEARTSVTSQLLIILHELGHIILEHPRTAVDHSFRTRYDDEYEMFGADAIADLIGPGPPVAGPSCGDGGSGGSRPGRPWSRGRRSAGRQPARSVYRQDIEWEAETLATILLTWIPGYGSYVPPHQRTPAERVLGDDGEW